MAGYHVVLSTSFFISCKGTFHRCEPFSLVWPCFPLDPRCHFDMLCECVKRTCWQKGMLDHGGGEHIPQVTTRHRYNILCNKSKFLSKIYSSCAVTLDPFVSIVKCLCGRQSCTRILEKTVDLPLEIIWKSAWWGRAEDGVGGKKSGFSFLNALISTKLHSYSKPIYSLSIYTNFNTLRDILKFDLNSREF